MYTIKALNGSSEEIIYSPETQDDRPVVNAKGSFELNEGGSLDLVLAYGHPLFDQLDPISTYVSVLDDNEEIFYGRITAKSDPTFTGEISYQAEGALCLLRDSQIPPDARDSSGQQTSRSMSAEAFFRWCIDQHNTQLNDPRRTFTVGEVTATKRNEVRDYQVGSYTETKSAIDQFITDVYGGYLRVRNVNGTRYIDWIQDYGRTNPQEITIGVNVRSLNNTIGADGFFTALLPVGNNGLTLDTPTINLFPPDKMAQYGKIIKTVNFNSVTTKGELQIMANNYVDRLNMVVPAETSIQLIDMHYLDGTVPKIRLGDKFNNIHGISGMEFTVGHVDRDFISPENDAFAFRNKHDLEGDLTGATRSGGISRSAGRSAGGAGLALKYYHELDDEAKINAKTIQLLGVTVHTQGDNIDSLSAIVETQGESIRTIQGTEVIQNSSEIAQVAGKFQLLNNYYDDWPDWQPNHEYKVGDRVKVLGSQGGYYGYICTTNHTSSGDFSSDRSNWTEQHGRQGVRLLDGAALEIDDDNGIRMTVGTRINDVDGAIADINHDISVFYGSALWAQRDNITGVVGQYELQTDPVTGEKSLVIVNGGGFRIRYNQTEYGVFHEGNLEGGMLVRAINTGSYTNVRTVWFKSDYTKAYANPERTHEVTGQTGAMYIDATNSTGENSRYEWDPTTQKYKLMTVYETHIKGDRVIVGTVDDQTAQTMQAKFGELDGLVASKATIGQLNALSARVGDIEADYITTDNLATRFGQITGSLLLSGNMVVTGDGSISVAASKMTFSNTAGSTVTTRNPKDFIRNVQVVADGATTYKLQYQLAFDSDSTWRDAGTFNRAGSVTLSGSWTGSKYTVTATNATNSISIGFTQDSDVQLSVATNGTPTQSSSSILTQPVRVIQTQGTTQTDRWTGNLTINASDVYDSGFDAGESSVTLSGAWSGSKYTVSSSNSHSISIGFTQDSDVQLSVATNGTPTQSKINPAILTQPMRVIQTQGTTQTNRWTGNVTIDAGDVYESGETDGQNDVRIVKGSWSSGIVSFRKSVGTADTKTVQLTSSNVSWNTSTNVGYVNIWDGTAADSEHGVSTGYTVSVDASSRYEAGVSDGKDAVGITFGEWDAGQITFDKTEGRSTPRIVCLSAASPTWSGNTASVKIRDYFNGGGSGNRRDTGYTVTVDATPCYNSGYTAGRSAGLSAAKIKRGSWNNGFLSFQISEDGSDNYDSVYIVGGDVVWSGNTGTVVLYEWVNSQTRYDTGQRVTIDASGASSASYNQGYTAGINAVTINKGSWSGGQITFSKSTGTASNRTVQLSAGTVSWSNNTASVPIKDTSSNVNTGYTVSVDATARYNAGVTAGKNAVTVVKGSWSGGQITFSKSEGTANTKTITLAKGTVSWNGTTVSIPILDSSASTGYTVSVDASGKLQSATYTSNGTYTPSSGYIGIKSVTVNVPTGGGSISGISINNPTFYDSQASLPSVDATLTTMGTLINRYKNNRGYIYFNVTMSGVSGSKKYRIPIGS